MGRNLESIDRLRGRIEHWRKTRKKRSPMPTDLWDAAVSIAREHGVYAVSRDLRLNHENLKKRVEGISGGRRNDGGGSSGFVELAGSQLIGTSGVVVELVDGNGAMLKIRLPGCNGLDVRGLAQAFWNRQG
jgi:hypothetical protein